MKDSFSSQNPVLPTPDTQVTTILENISDGFIALDSQWCFTYLNRAAERIVYRKREEVLGKNIWEVFPEAVGTPYWTQYHAAVETQQIIDFDAFYAPLQRWYRARLYPSLEGLMVYFQDITRHKLSEKETDEGLALLVDTLLMDTAPIGFAFFDTDLRFRRLNKRLADINGRAPYEHIGKTIGEVIPALDKAVTRVLQTVVETGEPVLNIEFAGATSAAPDTIKHWLASYYPVRAQSEALLGIGAFVLDITERKCIEEALRQSEVKFKSLFEAGIVGVIIADATGRFEDANDAFVQMIGYSKEELTGGQVRWHDLTPPEYQEAEAKMAQAMIETGVAVPWEKEYIRKDGTRFSALVGGAMIDWEHLRAVALILDITQQKELEQRKDDIISIASHELKTPITTLQGMTQLLKKRLEKSAAGEVSMYLARMETQIKSLTRLINELLDVSKIQAGMLPYAEEPVAIDALVQDVVETMQQASTTHMLSIQGASSKTVTGDSNRLGQVFTNLISNAIKYSPQADKVDISITASQDTVTIGVRDYGVGIPREHQSRLFERFYRVYDSRDKAFPGLGMGLYIAYEIARRHGGDIMVESEKGQGSLFSVVLPLERKG